MEKREWGPILATVAGLLVGVFLILTWRSHQDVLTVIPPVPTDTTTSIEASPGHGAGGTGAGQPGHPSGPSSAGGDARAGTSQVTGGGGGRAVPPGGGGGAPENLAWMKSMNDQLAEFAAKRKQEALAYLEQKVSDTSLATKTREVYRLRLIPNLRTGHDALKQKDYRRALAEYEKSLRDPHASPVTKYLIYRYMIEAAAKLRDPDRYFEYLKASAELQRDHDLAVLGLKKTDRTVKWAEKLAEQHRAQRDPALFAQLVEREAKKRSKNPSEKALESARAKLEREIDTTNRVFVD